jgi:hypothetical protein
MNPEGTYLQVLLETFEVQTNGLLIEVSITFNFKARVAENWSVVTPSRIGKINCLRMWIVARKEGTSDSKSSSSRDRLSDTNLLNLKTSYGWRKYWKRTRFSVNGALSAPYASLAANFAKSANPVMGRYSLSGLALLISSSACSFTCKRNGVYATKEPHLLDARKYVGLPIFITVGTNTQIDFARILVCLESLRNA